jgi:hypothetical protein
MAELDPVAFEGKYNHASTGLFKDNTSNDIEEDDMRALVTDVKDSFAANFKVITPSTAGGTITLDFSNRQLAVFVGSASFASAKAVAMSNDSAAVKFDLAIQITNVAATLDFGSGSVFKSNHNDFTPGTQVFAPSDTGYILITGTKVGSNWWLEFKYGFA